MREQEVRRGKTPAHAGPASPLPCNPLPASASVPDSPLHKQLCGSVHLTLVSYTALQHWSGRLILVSGVGGFSYQLWQDFIQYL